MGEFWPESWTPCRDLLYHSRFYILYITSPSLHFTLSPFDYFFFKQNIKQEERQEIVVKCREPII